MLFIIIENQKKDNLLENIEHSLEVNSELLKEGFSLIISKDKIRKVFNILSQEKIKAKILPPFISEDLYNTVFENENHYLDKIDLTENTLDKLFIKKHTIKSNSFYYIGPNDKSIKEVTTAISDFNLLLDENNLLIGREIFLMGFKDLLLKAIENTIKKEIDEDYYTIESVEAQNESFFLSCVAEFILLASEFYTKEEIKTYIESDLMNELDS